MRILASVIALAILTLSSAAIYAGDTTCKGYSSASNPFLCGEHGNCTWWAAYKRVDLKTTMRRSATYWFDDARGKGFPTGQTPRELAVVVFSATESNPAGHVAYVERTYPDGSFDASEMDWFGSLGTGDGVQRTTYHPVSGGYRRGSGASVWSTKGFIYPLCDSNKWKCDIRVSGDVGWFPPVSVCQSATQWFVIGKNANGEKYPIGIRPDASACPMVCYAN